MSVKFESRRYQERTIENFKKWKDTGGKLATIIYATGLGKTLCTALCINHVPGLKVLWVAHRRELIDQAYNTLKQVVEWTANIQKEIGKHKADLDSDIVVGSVQTFARKRKHLQDYQPDIIVIDEYHHQSEKNKTYQSLFDRFPNAKVIGLTATPFRFSGDNLPLGEVLFEMDIGTAVAHNYLVPLKPEVLRSDVSLANVKTQMGDFSVKELSQTINVEERNKLIINRVKGLVNEGRQGVVFGADVNHSKALCKLAQENGISSAEIYGETPEEERDKLVKLIQNRQIDCTFNNLTMTEGTDVPHWSFAVIARPTRFLGLYIQCAGRVARKCDAINKQDAIIVDVYDKLKVKQSRVTFSDMAYEGDMYGERKRANNILTADINWKQPNCAGASSDHVATCLLNFPVFMIRPDECRWTTDDYFMPITSWVIATDQRLITWTEDQLVQRLVEKNVWKPLVVKPTQSLIKEANIKVKHEQYGIGRVVDVGLGLEVQVAFDGDGWMSGQKEFIPINKLRVAHKVNEYASERDKVKTNRVFYLCFPAGVTKGRIIEMKKNKQNLHVIKDDRMTKSEAEQYIVAAARQADVFHLVRSEARWKNTPISNSQKALIENFMSNGKIRFDLDMDTMTKGDASAVIEQVKWQNIINEKFGTNSKDKLLGYDFSVEDV